MRDKAIKRRLIQTATEIVELGFEGGDVADQLLDVAESRIFEISQQEFLDLLFEDMALPNLTKRQLAGVEEFQTRRAGYSSTGTPSNIDIRRSMRAAVWRLLARKRVTRDAVRRSHRRSGSPKRPRPSRRTRPPRPWA